MTLNELEEANALFERRKEMARALSQKELVAALPHGNGFRFNLRSGLIDDAMAEAVEGAIRAELNRRVADIDMNLRFLGVDTEAEVAA